MRILLDECLPKKLKRHFPGHEVKTVPDMGWAGKKNGDLLALVEPQFDIFITADQNLQYQQNLKGKDIVIFVLKVLDARYESFRLLIPKVLGKITGDLRNDIIEITSIP